VSILRWLLWGVARLVFGLRYRIRLHGVDGVRSLEGPILILPNHPAYIDPPIVLTMLFPLFRPRPLLLERNFRSPLLYPLMRVLKAIRVPDLERTSAEARQRTAEAIDSVEDALRRRQNVILWPSGRLQQDGLERLGAARTTSNVLDAVPDAKIVLVRTRGLSGSRFSFGWDGTDPPFERRLVRGAGLLLANLLFFAPRREVDITLEHMDRSRLPGRNREVLNPFLDAWYNDPGRERPTFVPAHFLFGPRTREFPHEQAGEEADLSGIKPEIRDEVDQILAAKLGKNPASVDWKPTTALDDLGLDSLDRMEISLIVERRFGFQGDQIPTTAGRLYALAAGLLEREPPRPPPPAWFRAPPDPAVEIMGETLGESFVLRALACRRDSVCADDRSGVVTYERLLAGALIMSRPFANLRGDNVGVLLPSSVACDVTLMGLYLAAKLPVVLNWTTGPANLAHAARIMGLSHVITSRQLIDRIGARVEGTQYLYLEDLRKKIGAIERLRILLEVRLWPQRVRRRVPRPDPDRPAVVLFTSGSEKAPKAVPLSHRNILTNLRDGLEMLKVTRKDSMLAFLPAFHSFGMSITGLFPILSGLRVIRHPDPTDAAALARKSGTYRPTILAGTPTFVSHILDRAGPGELTSLRLIIVGAEKCPESVFDRLAKASPSARVLEGYGITECSPVVSVNPPDAIRPGTVGKPLSSLEVRVVDLESDAFLPPGKMGMLLVSGPTVFRGYIGHDGPSPFRERDGKRWYVTGDLVELDEHGYIRFSGRLKRFIKAGGEMISLPALEEPFTRLFPPTRDGPRVAVEGVELEGGDRQVVLFSTEPISLREANDRLIQEGFHGVMRVDEVCAVNGLPVLGTGKTDYMTLRAMIQARNAANG